MATKTVTETICDLDGTVPATETIVFGLNGRSYTIDLSEAYAQGLHDAFAPYIAVANQVRGPRSAPAKRLYDPAAVRRWAVSQGAEVSARGRVSAELIAAYQAAGN